MTEAWIWSCEWACLCVACVTERDGSVDRELLMGMIVRCMLENAMQRDGSLDLELCVGMIVRCMLENAL